MTSDIPTNGATKPVDQTPTLDPLNAIHARVMTMDELALHMRREELNRIPVKELSFDELTELCAVLALLRRKKSGPPSEATTRKRLKTPSQKPDIKSLPL